MLSLPVARQCSITPDARDADGCGRGEEGRHNHGPSVFAGRLIEGAPLRLAAEMARVVKEDKLHVIPIVTARFDRKCQLAANNQENE